MGWTQVLASPAPFLRCDHLEAIVLIDPADNRNQVVTCRVCDLVAVMVTE